MRQYKTRCNEIARNLPIVERHREARRGIADSHVWANDYSSVGYRDIGVLRHRRLAVSHRSAAYKK